MPKLFLSYRRADNPYAAGRLYDHLVDAFGEEEVFFDVAGGYGGIDFRKLIDYKIAECDAVIVVIGEKWLTLVDDEGNRRIDQPNDIVHIEIRSALDRGVPITPIFVGAGKIPKKTELPEVLRDLCYRNGFEASFESFRTQVKPIITAIRNGIEHHRKMTAASKPPVKQTVVIENVPTEILEAIHSAVPVEAATRAGEEIDVFISFAHGDNAPVSADQEGWVTSFHRVLQRMLSQRLGRQARVFSDQELIQGDSMTIDHAYVERLEKATTFVAVITPRYLRSKWCINELERFKPTITNGRSNLFPVYRFPIVNRDEIPAHAQDLLGYHFYAQEEGIPITLEAESREFINLVYTLVVDISRTIKSG
ncbi:MAG TPA: hypothetical protein DDY43_04580 [Synechococcales bacterium UBA10510]|nr:hypothetical protein [Synechococcales bacterium UBA10510]